MDKLVFTKRASIFLALVFVLSSCMKTDVYRGGNDKPLDPTEVFDFSLTKQVKLSIDYGFNNDYYILFDLYEQNPLIEQDGAWVKDETLTSIYSASTDKKGKYSGTISLPTDITEVWLYSEYLGAISPVKLSINNGEISFNQNSHIASLQTKTRGVTNSGYTYEENVGKTMPGVDWDIYGLPTNIESSLSMPPADILYSIKETYSGVKNKMIKDLHPDWLENNRSSEIKIIKDTEISLVFISSGASWNNTVGYFTYPTGTTPTEKTIQKIIAFPNISTINKMNGTDRAGAMICGHEIKLKYWDGKQFSEKFPAGISIGWYLEGNSFNKGSIKKQSYADTRYSYNRMNADQKQRVVALRHADTDQLVAVGFEDNADFNYTDATFYVKIAESVAISSDIPELPSADAPLNVTSVTKGTLAFEDQWPSQGDYDMNDVIIEYNSTRFKNAVSGKVYKIVDEFTPVHNGGILSCGFGYQLSQLESSRVSNISVSGSANWSVEAGQTHPTIILFDSQKSVLGKKVTVTIDLSDVDEAQITAPYNPFIFANERSKEIHLVNYPPTDKADMDLFNTKDDVSNTSAGVYYIARYKDEVELMPYCINLPILNFKCSDEGVKIYDTYPDFIKWAKSGGKTNTNWYK